MHHCVKIELFTITNYLQNYNGRDYESVDRIRICFHPPCSDKGYKVADLCCY